MTVRLRAGRGDRVAGPEGAPPRPPGSVPVPTAPLGSLARDVGPAHARRPGGPGRAAPGPPVPERLDESLALDFADGLRSGEAAVVVELDDPTPLLVVEILRVHGLGLLRSTLPIADQALMSALFEQDHFA